MKQVVIENPILNSPYEQPRRHFKFTEDCITDEIVEARSALYSTTSYLFETPKTGKIAINHF